MTLPKWFVLTLVFTVQVCAQKRYDGKLLEKGQSDPSIQLMQFDLYYLGYGIYMSPYGGASGTFNEATVRAVKAFQSDKDMMETGVMDTKTTEEMEKALSQNELGEQWTNFNPLRYQAVKFQKGDRDRGKGHLVEMLQSDLAGLGYSVAGDERGVFGVNTDKAIKKLQEDAAIPSTGILDENTTNTIVSRLCIKGLLAKKKK